MCHVLTKALFSLPTPHLQHVDDNRVPTTESLGLGAGPSWSAREPVVFQQAAVPDSPAPSADPDGTCQPETSREHVLVNICVSVCGL